MNYYIPTDEQNAQREAFVLEQYRNFVKVYQSEGSNPMKPWSTTGFAHYMMAIKCAEPECLKEVYLYTHTEKSFNGKYTEYCFDCALWHEKLDTFDRNQLFVLDPLQKVIRAYHLKDDSERIVLGNKHMLGFGGHWWRIERLLAIKDGTKVPTEVVYTNNLWSNGTVPREFESRFLPRINALLKNATPEEIQKAVEAYAGKE